MKHIYKGNLVNTWFACCQQEIDRGVTALGRQRFIRASAYLFCDPTLGVDATGGGQRKGTSAGMSMSTFEGLSISLYW